MVWRYGDYLDDVNDDDNNNYYLLIINRPR